MIDLGACLTMIELCKVSPPPPSLPLFYQARNKGGGRGVMPLRLMFGLFVVELLVEQTSKFSCQYTCEASQLGRVKHSRTYPDRFLGACGIGFGDGYLLEKARSRCGSSRSNCDTPYLGAEVIASTLLCGCRLRS